ncbi:S41 family peptidase [Candidatus Riflebacteria bacterium]
MKNILTFLLFFTFFTNLHADINSINDYYGISKKQVLVFPTLNLTESMQKKVRMWVKNYGAFLAQWGDITIISDQEFQFKKNETRVLYFIGTENTNSVLKNYKEELLAKTDKEGLSLCGKNWPDRDIGAFFLNQFHEKLALVFYLPDLNYLEQISRVFHGGTEFIIFNSLSFGNNPDFFLARGFFNKKGSQWKISETGYTERIPQDLLIFVSEIRESTPLNVGDVLRSIEQKKIFSSTIDKIYKSSDKEKKLALTVLRDGKEKQFNLTLDEIFRPIQFDYCPESILQIPQNHVQEEFDRVIEKFKGAYVDTFDYKKTEDFRRACRQLKDLEPSETVSIIEIIKKLAQFASKCNDGHVYINHRQLKSFLMTGYALNGYKVFPFQPIISAGKILIPENSFNLPVGSQLIKMDQFNYHELLDLLAHLNSGDTRANKLSSLARDSFSDFLFLTSGEKKQFQLDLLSEGKIIKRVIQAVPFYKRENQLLEEKWEPILKLDSETLVLRLDSFAHTPDFSKTVNKAFKVFARNKMKNLVIDIRQNGGGSTRALNLLLAHLIRGKYRVYKMTRNIRCKEAENEGFEFEDDVPYGQRTHYNITSQFDGGTKQFMGKVFLFTGPKTFSTAFDCTAVLKERLNAFIIGQPAGGKIAQSGNHFRLSLFKRGLDITVPYKDFLPDMQTVKDYQSPEASTVLQPDLSVEMTEEAIKNKTDPCVSALKKYLKFHNSFEKLHHPDQ